MPQIYRPIQFQPIPQAPDPLGQALDFIMSLEKQKRERTAADREANLYGLKMREAELGIQGKQFDLQKIQKDEQDKAWFGKEVGNLVRMGTDPSIAMGNLLPELRVRNPDLAKEATQEIEGQLKNAKTPQKAAQMHNILNPGNLIGAPEAESIYFPPKTEELRPGTVSITRGFGGKELKRETIPDLPPDLMRIPQDQWPGYVARYQTLHPPSQGNNTSSDRLDNQQQVFMFNQLNKADELESEAAALDAAANAVAGMADADPDIAARVASNRAMAEEKRKQAKATRARVDAYSGNEPLPSEGHPVQAQPETPRQKMMREAGLGRTPSRSAKETVLYTETPGASATPEPRPSGNPSMALGTQIEPSILPGPPTGPAQVASPAYAIPTAGTLEGTPIQPAAPARGLPPKTTMSGGLSQAWDSVTSAVGAGLPEQFNFIRKVASGEGTWQDVQQAYLESMTLREKLDPASQYGMFNEQYFRALDARLRSGK